MNAEELAQLIADKIDPPYSDYRRKNLPIKKLMELYPDREDWYEHVEVRKGPEDHAYVVKTAYDEELGRNDRYITAAKYIEIAEAALEVLQEFIDSEKARAWDKGYNKGREDSNDWTVRIGGVQNKTSRNPYRRRLRSKNE